VEFLRQKVVTIGWEVKKIKGMNREITMNIANSKQEGGYKSWGEKLIFLEKFFKDIRCYI